MSRYYSSEFKRRAVELSEQRGPKLAAETLGMPVRTLGMWRTEASVTGRPSGANYGAICANPYCSQEPEVRWFCEEHAALLARIREELEKEGDAESSSCDHLTYSVPFRLLGTSRGHLAQWSDPTGNEALAVAR